MQAQTMLFEETHPHAAAFAALLNDSGMFAKGQLTKAQFMEGAEAFADTLLDLPPLTGVKPTVIIANLPSYEPEGDPLARMPLATSANDDDEDEGDEDDTEEFDDYGDDE